MSCAKHHLKRGELKDRPMVISRYGDRSIDGVPLERIFDANRKQLSRSVSEFFETPMMGWYYPTTMGQLLINTSSVKKMSLDDLVKITDPNSKVGCPCHTNRFRKFVDKSCGHVRTTDLTIIRNIKLRNLVAKGTKYRVPDDEWLDWEPNLGESGRICGVTVTDCFRTAAIAEGLRK